MKKKKNVDMTAELLAITQNMEAVKRKIDDLPDVKGWTLKETDALEDASHMARLMADAIDGIFQDLSHGKQPSPTKEV